MPTYIATINTTQEGYIANFPDFPELEAQALSLDAVRIEAQGILEEHLATTFDDLPAQISTLEDVAAKHADKLLIALNVNQPKSRSVRINITIPEDILIAVDRSAKAHGMSRSRLLTKAVEATMTGQGHDGIKIPLSEDVLTAVDRAAKAHDMNRIPLLIKLIESGISGKGHDGIKLPLNDEILAAVDKAAEAHDMNRIPFLIGVIKVAVGLSEGHGKKHSH